MKAKTETVNGRTKQDEKYLALIDEYLKQIKEARADMKRSKAEIDRMEIRSRRKLAEIDSILKGC